MVGGWVFEMQWVAAFLGGCVFVGPLMVAFLGGWNGLWAMVRTRFVGYGG